MLGILRKMKVELSEPINYYLRLGDEELLLNDFLDKPIKLDFQGNIFCKKCGKKIKRSFQGFCFDHFQNAPEAAECILRPELCRAHLGEGRDPEWEEKNHNQPHLVYLALSGGVKVGVTRETQVPTRWIDQGASKAIPFARTPNRYLAGMIEVDMMQYLGDKTPWQKMISNNFDNVDLSELGDEYKDYLDPKYEQYLVQEEALKLPYPVLLYPEVPSSVNFDKQNSFEGVLKGIKGQYLINEKGEVINLRRHEGYEISFEG